MGDSNSEYPPRLFRGRKPINPIEIPFYEKIESKSNNFIFKYDWYTNT